LNFVTKIFVVLVAALSIALVGMVIPFVASQNNYKQQVDDAREAARLADQRVRLKDDQLQLASDSLARIQEEQNQQIVDLKKELQSIVAQRTSMQNELAMEKVINAQNTAELKGLAAAERQHAEIVKAMAGELGTLREREIRLRQEIVMQTDAAGELAGQLAASQRQARSLEERLALSVAESKRLTDLLAKVPSDVLAPIQDTSMTSGQPILTVPPVEVNGKITKVQEMDQQTFVQVDIGSQDQVGERTKLVIVRKGQFIGTVEVIESDPKVAVGRVLLLAKGPIQVGDSVVTGPGYN
jgi:hypothetical protein